MTIRKVKWPKFDQWPHFSPIGNATINIRVEVEKKYSFFSTFEGPKLIYFFLNLVINKNKSRKYFFKLTQIA